MHIKKRSYLEIASRILLLTGGCVTEVLLSLHFISLLPQVRAGASSDHISYAEHR